MWAGVRVHHGKKARRSTVQVLSKARRWGDPTFGARHEKGSCHAGQAGWVLTPFVLCRNRSGTVLEPFWNRSGTVLEPFQNRSGTVLKPFRKRSKTAGVPERILNRSGTVLEP